MSTPSIESMAVQRRTVDGITLRVAESAGQGRQHDHTIVLTSPWPESLYAFLPLWQSLSAHARLIAVDLPGFGQSEHTEHLLSPQAMGEFLIDLVDAWGLDTPHVVGPDVGTSAALFAVALHPGKLRSIVVGSGGVAYPLQVSGGLKEIIEAPDLDAFRASDSRIRVGRALDAGHERYHLPDAVREDFLQSYDGDRFVESMRYVRSYPRELPILRQRLPAIQTPVQIISGKHDPLVPATNFTYLHDLLPNSKLDLLDAGHFVWEDVPDEYAALIVAWIEGGYQHPCA